MAIWYTGISLCLYQHSFQDKQSLGTITAEYAWVRSHVHSLAVCDDFAWFQCNCNRF